MKKQQINLVNLKALLKGRNWKELSKKEQLDISRKILSQLFPKSQNL